MKKKWIAVLLALFAGSFGAHRFYLRQAELGIAYIAIWIWVGKFFGFPISTLIGWYDAYRYMIMDQNEFDRKYNAYFFRDRYGNRREMPRNQQTRRGQYILMDEDAQTTSQNKKTYFELNKRKKESESFKQSGIKKFKDYDIKGAIEDFNKAVELDAEDKALHFNLACAYSISEEASKSFYHLNQARLLGFSDWNKVLTHESLAYIRVLKEFDAWKNNQFVLTQDMVNSLKQHEQEKLELKNNEKKFKTEMLLGQQEQKLFR